MKKTHYIVLLSFLVLLKQAFGQEIETADPLKKHTWKAQWIAHPSRSLTEYGVYHFRKIFELEQKPDRLIVHVSADNRYRLFVNGIVVCSGPAVGDLQNWYYETVDIAPPSETKTSCIP